MQGSRENAIERARSIFASGEFVERLQTLVAIPTESARPERLQALHDYCHKGFGPMLEAAGFKTHILANPVENAGPVVIGMWIEDPSLPTMLVYGHGDVVNAQPERWRKDLDPFAVKVEGDKIYGRGVVDNKGQHLVALDSLRAVIAERGKLGFNVKLMVETGEESGSPGLLPFLQQHKELCAADAFIALDGPRLTTFKADVSLGSRGGVGLDLIVDLREGGHHSGHWGGLIVDAGFILAHALSSIVGKDGRILVPGWTPANVPQSVLDACAKVEYEDLPGLPEMDPAWGEPGRSRAERIHAWTSVIVLASISGQPESPINAVPGFAKSRIQIRHTVDVDAQTLVPNLRKHLDGLGLSMVKIVPVTERDMFPPSRTDPNDPWVRKVVASMERTAGRPPNVLPSIGASGPSEFFKETLNVPIMWIPHSYGGCSQHGPDEHGLGSLFEDGLGIMAGIWWDIGEKA